MKSFKWLGIFVFVISYQYQSLAIPSEDGPDLIETTCKRTENHYLCVKILRTSNPRSSSSGGADVKGLAHIVIDVALGNATENLAQVKKLLKETSDPVVKQCLGICSTEYDAAVTDIPAAAALLDSKNYRDARGRLEDAAREAETCEESFGENPPRPSPLTARNKLVMDLARLSGDIISILG